MKTQHLTVGQRVKSPIYGFGTVVDESALTDAVYVQYDRVDTVKTYWKIGLEINSSIDSTPTRSGATAQVEAMNSDNVQIDLFGAYAVGSDESPTLQMIAAKDISTHELTVITYRSGLLYGPPERLSIDEFKARRPVLFDDHFQTDTMRRFSEMLEARRLNAARPNVSVRGAAGCKITGSMVCISPPENSQQ